MAEPPMDERVDSENSYVRVRASTPPAVAFNSNHSASLSTNSSAIRDLWTWASTLWPLILHCISALGVANFIILFVDGNDFNLTERRPSIILADGTTIMSSQYALLQSDITTLVSIFVSCLRWLLAIWAGALCWYSLFLLMEKTGLPHRDLRWMACRGLFPPSSYFRNSLTFLTGGILLVTTLLQFAAPILTGSITWTPSAQSAELLSNAFIDIAVGGETNEWYSYLTDPLWRERVRIQAGGFAAVAWGRNAEKGILKRALPSAAPLPINTTITNVTIPYFSITSLEWISDPRQSLTEAQLNISDLVDGLGVDPGRTPLTVPGSLVFLPDTKVDQAAQWRNRSFPPASIVSETRLVVVYTSFQPGNSNCSDNSGMSGNVPPTAGYYYYKNEWCYVFVRVGYQAGAGVCNNCRIASDSTVQNDTTVLLQEDPLTKEALQLMPGAMTTLVLLNASIPSNWGKFDDYVTEVLARSYSGAWTALAQRTGNWSPKLRSSFVPALPSSRAVVHLGRVYMWLGMQLLATLLGFAFLGIQTTSQYPLAGETNMIPFYLDTGDVSKPDRSGELEVDEQLRVKPKGAQWRITVDKQPPSP